MSERLTHITIVEKDEQELLPGEVTLVPYGDRHYWMIRCPSPACGLGSLARHNVAYDEQRKLLTVSQSIRCICGIHYRIDNNEIGWLVPKDGD